MFEEITTVVENLLNLLECNSFFPSMAPRLPGRELVGLAATALCLSGERGLHPLDRDAEHCAEGRGDGAESGHRRQFVDSD